jgi:hypothetical protein
VSQTGTLRKNKKDRKEEKGGKIVAKKMKKTMGGWEPKRASD